MNTLTRNLIDHRHCPPGKHRHTADSSRMEDADPGTGRLRCPACNGPLMHCAVTDRANNRQDRNGYEQVYVHPDATDVDHCPAETRSGLVTL